MYDVAMRTHSLQEEVSIPSHEGRTLWAPGASGKSRGSQKMRLREEGTGWQKQERGESSVVSEMQGRLSACFGSLLGVEGAARHGISLGFVETRGKSAL